MGCVGLILSSFMVSKLVRDNQKMRKTITNSLPQKLINNGSLSTVVGDEKLTSREDRIGPFFDILLVSKKSLKDRLKIMIDLAPIFLYQFKELIYSLLLKVK
ncbi:hypothetical protein ACXOJ5_05490, partial [Streptococcus thermophilus]